MINAVIDHSSRFGAARDQGRRPTCLAFAASDGHADHRGSGSTHLSADYLFYRGAQRQLPVRHDNGVQTDAIVSALSADGQPVEQHYPYNSTLDAPSKLPEPVDPFPHPLYRVGWVYETFSEQSVLDILNRGQAVVLALKITQSFFLLSIDQPVLAWNPVNDAFAGVHAVVGVGHGKDKDGAIYLKIRNSWGDTWGSQGQAWIPIAYASKQVLWMATFEDTTV